MTKEELLPFCECGKCGLRVTKKGNRFIHGHNIRGDNNPMKNPDTAKKMSKTKMGVPNSPEHNASISKAKTGVSLSPKHIATSARGLTEYYEENPEAGAEMSRIKKQWFIDHPEAIVEMSERTTEQFSDQANCDAMSEILKNSEAAKSAAEKQRGGNDIVEHHAAYDMKCPKALIVKITRKFHSSIHHPKGCQFGTYGYSLID